MSANARLYTEELCSWTKTGVKHVLRTANGNCRTWLHKKMRTKGQTDTKCQNTTLHTQVYI